MANNDNMHALKHKINTLIFSISQNFAKRLANVTLGRGVVENFRSCMGDAVSRGVGCKLVISIGAHTCGVTHQLAPTLWPVLHREMLSVCRSSTDAGYVTAVETSVEGFSSAAGAMPCRRGHLHSPGRIGTGEPKAVAGL